MESFTAGSEAQVNGASLLLSRSSMLSCNWSWEARGLQAMRFAGGMWAAPIWGEQGRFLCHDLATERKSTEGEGPGTLSTDYGKH